jgi:hypothetical protein
MIGISADNLIWIGHFFFAVSRTKPKIDLRKLIIIGDRLGSVVGLEIERDRVSFSRGNFWVYNTVFIDYEMREGVIKLFVLFLYFFVFCFLFLSVGRFFVPDLTYTEI